MDSGGFRAGYGILSCHVVSHRMLCKLTVGARLACE